MSHRHMAFSIDECVEMSHLKNKITGIIPTYSGRIDCLMWSVFSLLLRSKVGGILEHLCVNINGPDTRTGDPSLQDRKQEFLSELRDLDWYNVDDPSNKRQMPLTVIRAWSRVGFAETYEMALPWIHTDAYFFSHDDVIFYSQWQDEITNKFYSENNVALGYVDKLVANKVQSAIHHGMYLIVLPQVETTFIAVKKKWMLDAGATWTGYHIPNDDNVCQFDLSEIGDIEEFLRFWREKDLLQEPIMQTELYNFVRQEMGSWVYYKLSQKGRDFVKLNDDIILHIGKQTCYEPVNAGDPCPKMARIEKHRDEIRKLEQEIAAHPEYSKLYEKYRSL